MVKKTVIVGNGLGMALDPDQFSLQNALLNAWTDSECLTSMQKTLIKNCINAHAGKDHPEGEDDLDSLHLAVLACQFLAGISSQEAAWLTSDGLSFPIATLKYFTRVSWQFHRHDHRLPLDFIDPFVAFVKDTNSHVATLNYDNLLYQAFIDADVLNGYDGPLVDGFHDDGFEDQNMERQFSHTFGYYLHLHGTPLYVEKDGHTIKQKQGAAMEIPTRHLVLNHLRHKRSVIDASHVLHAYWRRLSLALQESDAVLVFGYSGLDVHLNEVLQAHTRGKRIHVVEWRGAGEKETREAQWRTYLGVADLDLTHLDNILEFKAWAA